MTKKTNKIIDKCIERSAESALYLLSRMDDDYFRDPAASLAKICDAVSTLASLGGTGDGSAPCGVIVLPEIKEEQK